MPLNYGDYPDLTDAKRILVIKLRHLGDVLLSTPVLSNLKKRFPDAEIDAYVWEECVPILEGHPAISHVIFHDRKWKKLPFVRRLVKEMGLLRKIRKKRYDLVINLTEGDRGAIAAFASGAKVKVGVDPGKGKKQKIFTHLVKPCPNPRHTVERDLDALRRIGIFPRLEERELFFHVPDEAKEQVNEWVGEEPFVVIHAVSRWRFKCLPPQLMGRVIDQLKEKVILTGAPSERELVDEVVKHTKGNVINLAGKTSLKEMGALMLRAKGVITVDSVALHLASALKTPVVALFGPTSEENWGPWQHPNAKIVAQNRSCRPCRLDGCGGSKMSDCLWTLSPQEIVEAFSAVVSARSGEGVSDSAALFILNSFETNKTE